MIAQADNKKTRDFFVILKKKIIKFKEDQEKKYEQHQKELASQCHCPKHRNSD